MTDFATALETRLVRYVQIDTEADEKSTTTPSTAKQYDLLNLLKQELEEIGASDIWLTDKGILYATVPATVAGAPPVVAFLAHVDTAPAFTGKGVKALVHRAYDGGDIVLPDDPSQVISPQQFPYLSGKVGHTVITASGTTLLGADDKSGVAVIMTTAEHLLKHPEIPHGPVRLCFTPDEEIGTGIRHLDPADLGADVAYTLDGGPVGHLVYESFSADRAIVTVTGVSTHTGTAYKQLVNAITLAAKIIDALPQHTLTPETTKDHEGFIHSYRIEGTSAKVEINFILRDFEREGLAKHGELIQKVCEAVQAGEPRAKIEWRIEKQYRNMRYWLENDMRPVELAERAMRSLGIEPIYEAIRGGTDGSQLTERGVPTPNLFTGQMNLHGPLEYISVQDMVKSTEVCLALVQEWGREAR